MDDGSIDMDKGEEDRSTDDEDLPVLEALKKEVSSREEIAEDTVVDGLLNETPDFEFASHDDDCNESSHFCDERHILSYIQKDHLYCKKSEDPLKNEKGKRVRIRKKKQTSAQAQCLSNPQPQGGVVQEQTSADADQVNQGTVQQLEVNMNLSKDGEASSAQNENSQLSEEVNLSVVTSKGKTTRKCLKKRDRTSKNQSQSLDSPTENSQLPEETDAGKDHRKGIKRRATMSQVSFPVESSSENSQLSEEVDLSVTSKTKKQPRNCVKTQKCKSKNKKANASGKKESSSGSQCRFCPEKFGKAHTRIAHERTHPDAHQVCEVCGEPVFIGQRTAHMRSHCELVCEYCGESVTDLARHLKERHIRELECDICGKRLSTKRRVEFHKEVCHSEGEVYPCRLCFICFKTKEELDEHDKTVPARHQTKCPVCLQGLVKNEYIHFRKHLLKHAVDETQVIKPSDSEEMYACPRCDREFSCLDYLQNHLLGHYVAKWKYECKKCYMMWGVPGLLTRHEIRCDGVNRMMHRDSAYLSKRGKTRRKRSISVKKSAEVKELLKISKLDGCGKKIYTCIKCDKEFRRLANAYIHIKSVHFKKSYCGVCGQLFDTVEERKEHVATHEKNNKTSCILCSKPVFYVHMKLHLIAHAKLETKHMTSSECPRCSREFSKMSHVHNHLLQHFQPQRVLECPHCFLALRYQSELDLHERSCEALFGKKKRIRKRTSRKLELEEECQVEETWECLECQIVFETEEECETHIGLNH